MIESGFFRTQDVVLTMTGAKASDLLHGQLTNDLKSLPVERANFNLLLNRKGKVRAMLLVCRDGDKYQIIVDRGQKTVIQDHFRMLAPLSRVEMMDGEESFSVYHVLCTAWMSEHAVAPYQVTREFYQQVLAFRSDRFGVPGLDVIVCKSDEDSFLNHLKMHQMELLSEEQAELLRIQNGKAKFGVDVTEDNLPQESRLDEALHFKKGCYLGQEVIARLHFRGHVNKRLMVFEMPVSEVHPGDVISVEGADKGVVTSVIRDDERQRILFLGYAPADLTEKSQGISVRDVTVKIIF